MWQMGTYEHLHGSYVLIFHIAIDRRVIRDVENEHLRTAAFEVVICPRFPHRD